VLILRTRKNVGHVETKMVVTVRNDKIRRVTLFKNSSPDSEGANSFFNKKPFESLLDWLCHRLILSQIGREPATNASGIGSGWS